MSLPRLQDIMGRSEALHWLASTWGDFGGCHICEDGAEIAVTLLWRCDLVIIFLCEDHGLEAHRKCAG